MCCSQKKYQKNVMQRKQKKNSVEENNLKYFSLLYLILFSSTLFLSSSTTTTTAIVFSSLLLFICFVHFILLKKMLSPCVLLCVCVYRYFEMNKTKFILKKILIFLWHGACTHNITLAHRIWKTSLIKRRNIMWHIVLQFGLKHIYGVFTFRYNAIIIVKSWNNQKFYNFF